MVDTRVDDAASRADMAQETGPEIDRIAKDAAMRGDMAQETGPESQVGGGPRVAARRSGLSDLALDRPVMVGMILLAIFVLGAIAVRALPLAFLPDSGSARVSVRIDLARTSPELVEREVIRPVEAQMAGLRGLQKIQVGSGGWGVRFNLEFGGGTDIDARKAEIRERLDRIRASLPDTISRITMDSWGRSDDAVLELRLASASGLTRDYDLIERLIIRPIERIPGVSRVELEGATPRELEVALDLEAVQRAGADLGQISAVLRGARQGRSLGVLRQEEINPGVRSPAVPADPEAFAALPVPRRAGLGSNGARGPPTGLSSGTGGTRSTGMAAPSASNLSAAAMAPRSASTLGSAASGGSTTTANTANTANSPAAAASPVTANGVAAARLGEVAEVAIHPRENRNFRRLDGQLGVDLDIFAEAGASPVVVAAAVRKVIAELQQSPRIGDLQVIVFQDQGEVILKTLADLRDTGIYGGLLGVVVLYLFLRRAGTTLVAALCIPLTLLATCGVLLLRGEELNCIVLLGLVLGVGMLVDNAVVIVEAIEHHAGRGVPAMQAIRQGGRDVSLATVASTLSSVIVFLPLVFGDPSDPMSAMLGPLGLTFAIVLLCSLFISQTLVPLLMPAVLKLQGTRPRATPWMDRVGGGYRWLIARTLRHRGLTLLVSLLLAASAYYPARALHFNLGELQPRPEALEIGLQFVGSPGYKEIGAKVEVIEASLLAQAAALGIAHVSCRYSDFWARCSAHPIVRAESEAAVEAFTERVTRALPEQAGVRYLVGENAQSQWRGSGDRREVELAIKGEDMGVLMELGEQAAEHLRKTLPRGDGDHVEAGGYDAVIGPYDEGSRELHVRLDSAAIHRHGLRADEVARLIQTAFQGLPLGQVRGPEGEIELRLSADGGKSAAGGEDGPSLADLRDLKIPVTTAAGPGEVAVGSLASFERTRSPFFVQRVDRETQVKVKVRFFTANPEKNKQIVKDAMIGFAFPPGYSSGDWARWSGRSSTVGETVINLGLCLLLVYAVMASLFESFLQPFAILVTCLLGCLGAPWLMWWTGTTVDTTAMVGLFILVGIVVNNGIMLIDRTLQLRGTGVPRDEALALAGRDRLRPILMTAGTTVLGLLPMLIHHPTLAGVYYHAIALVIAGGLVTSTIVTLVFLPATYSLLEDIAGASLDRWRWAFRLGLRK
ncbi:efflux RND transporter permease subunit [Nannocystis sp.]|uniref:efflux RND transporter permease subunit n=1 Tax=Nannocystis sp. TaxID=1962667 RepID=UPI0025D25634|nr:efflux RND transporter permease subunit [Nannocystis sp.]MBK7824113.1 efflux RND transporter permease subunit [Nannocystis sp.]